LNEFLYFSLLYTGYGEGYITPEAKDLIEKLLVSNPRKRLGYHGVQELKAHPFFQGEFNDKSCQSSIIT
jgi:hypothetical protein